MIILHFTHDYNEAKKVLTFNQEYTVFKKHNKPSLQGFLPWDLYSEPLRYVAFLLMDSTKFPTWRHTVPVAPAHGKKGKGRKKEREEGMKEESWRWLVQNVGNLKIYSLHF